MSAEKDCPPSGRFVWNELVSPDADAALAFYTGLFGWKAEPFPGSTPGGKPYVLFKKDGEERGFAGMAQCPEPGKPARWIPYVAVEDVDAVAAQAVKSGGKIVVEPFDIPTVGRIAIFVDPQGAAVGLIKPLPCPAS